MCLDTWHLLWLGFSVLPHPTPATVPFLLPRGKTPGSMKVAMLKFASTNKKTSPLYTGMAGEMAFVNQGHLWRGKVTGKGCFSCNTSFLPTHYHHTELFWAPTPAMQQGWICNVTEISTEPVSVITAIPSVKLLCSRAQKAQIVHRAHRALPSYCLICNLAFYYSV